MVARTAAQSFASLVTKRKMLRAELKQIDRQIEQETQALARIEERMKLLARARTRAA